MIISRLNFWCAFTPLELIRKPATLLGGVSVAADRDMILFRDAKSARDV